MEPLDLLFGYGTLLLGELLHRFEREEVVPHLALVALAAGHALALDRCAHFRQGEAVAFDLRREMGRRERRRLAQAPQDRGVDRQFVDRLAARLDLHERRRDPRRDLEARFEHARMVA